MSIELAQGSNRAFFDRAQTEALPETIWHLWTNPTTWKDWDSEIKNASLDCAMGLGAKGSLTPRFGFKAKFEVVEYEPIQYYAFRTKLPGATLTVKRSFIQTNPVVIFRHDVFFGGTLAWLWSFLLGNKFRQALPPVMRKLATVAVEIEQ